MIRTIVLLLSLSFMTVASADEITFSLISKHLTESGYNGTHKYNEVNPGVGYYFERQNVEIGTYVNSYAGGALYIARRFDAKYIDITYGMLLYDNFQWVDDNLHLSPFVMASKDFGQWRIGYSPLIRENHVGKWVYGVFTLQYFIPR